MHELKEEAGFSPCCVIIVLEKSIVTVVYPQYNLGQGKRKRSTEAKPITNLHLLALVLKVMNDVVFPTRLDFGAHALGETVRRTVRMVCKASANNNAAGRVAGLELCGCARYSEIHAPRRIRM